ncbi:hypothetical protein Val02_48850 [Virgisporangium aliadipatigenens]|uniref:Uncharacterized protein n=1 Tax=Virgisporangium aliadipatigenens TaxID=741659 RepID=A0A8J3YM25_9ACTN|nr:hypothetical protein [Virgisporangium aliadipatigenens]GIJ47999.1 hypothetical protein Val02_48850 [Virgisporangium aliadipatigenens]
MRSRAWIAAGIVVTVLGLVALAFGYPLSPRPDPAPVEVSFPGSYAKPGVIRVTKPGAYAIWQAGRTGGDRCRVSTESGAQVRVDEPGLTVRWHVDEDAVDLYTQVGEFDAPAAGTYGISCTIDDAPGTAFSVTEAPSTGLSFAALIGGSVAVVLGAAVVVVASVRRRRSAG